MPPSIKPLSNEVAAYIAGPIDGEGTITLTRVHANERRRLVVSIANTELELLQFVREATGIGKITRKRIVSERHTPSFCYSVSSTQALALLRQTAPWLRSYKQHRARLALDRYRAVTPRNGKYDPNTLQARAAFELAFLSIRPSGSARPGPAGRPRPAVVTAALPLAVD